jgi:hypothetical protein
MLTFKVVRKKPDDFESAVVRIDVSGFTTRHSLSNSEFDAATNTLMATSYWRGLGDTFSTGRWTFEQGEFVLKQFDVDASYDAKVNGAVIYKAGG